MKWQEILKKFELLQEWDMAIAHMQEVLEKNPDSLDAYLSMLYLVMNLIVEEDYDRLKHHYYASLCKKYFDESYEKFSENPEYLYYAGKIAVMSEWYFGLETKEREAMIRVAPKLNPNNLVYQWPYYSRLSKKEKIYDENLNQYLDLVLDPHSPIQKELSEKGSLGEYILDMMINWVQDVKDQRKSSE